MTIDASLKSNSMRNPLFPAGLIAAAAGGFWAASVLMIALITSNGIWQDVLIALTLFGSMLVWAGLIAFVATWTIGLAWHVIACAAGWRPFWAYAIAGVLAGAAIATLALPLSDSTVFSVFWLSSSGGVVSIVAWLIRRPDRDAPNPTTPPS